MSSGAFAAAIAKGESFAIKAIDVYGFCMFGLGCTRSASTRGEVKERPWVAR